MVSVKKRVSPRSLSTMPVSFPDICERLKQLRVQSGRSQADFESEIGVNVSTIKQIEAGNITPNIYVLRQYHKYFRVSYEWMIDGKK